MTAEAQPQAANWLQLNQRYLNEALDALCCRMVGEADDNAAGPSRWPADFEPALHTLAGGMGLSGFEQDLLLLCAGMELEPQVAGLCAQLNGSTGQPYPTFSLALAHLNAAEWSAITPASALRRWQLLHVTDGPEPVTQRRLFIDERVLHYLVGISYPDERLRGRIQFHQERRPLTARQRAQLEDVLNSQAHESQPPEGQRLHFAANDLSVALQFAAHYADAVELRPARMKAAALPEGYPEMNTLARIWEREAFFENALLLLVVDDERQLSLVRRFLDMIEALVIVVAPESLPPVHPQLLSHTIPAATSADQVNLLQTVLGDKATQLNGQVEALASQFDFHAEPLFRAAVSFGQSDFSTAAGQEQAVARLWDACRSGARPKLEDLAQRIEPMATWDELVLPTYQKNVLTEIASQVERRHQVYEGWGFARKSNRGLGISALFSGPSGTGKTMAAEVLAAELQLDLYRIDLASVVSKYIGDTEKNLKRIFDAAEGSGAILLFDEADALFGKRSDVKDAHDRHANIEVSFLLQRMEAFSGLAILTSNLPDTLDKAFLRRIRFMVEFPFPAMSEREAIWQTVFPAKTPVSNLQYDRLARLHVSGGNIRNIALNAAFIAAQECETVSMRHLLSAARTEYGKLKKRLTEQETEGWDV